MKGGNMTGRAVLVLMLLMVVSSSASGSRITVLTYEWPPFNFEEGGEIRGISTDVVREVLRRAGIEADIEMCPWARAYRRAMEEENVMLFTIARTTGREEHFKFICPVAPPVKNVLFRLSDRKDMDVGSLEDARSYRIGVQDKDVLHQLLLEAGFEENRSLFPVPDNEQNLKKLLSGRIDLMAGHDLPTLALLKGMSQAGDRLEIVYTFDSFEECAAFGRKTSDDLVEKIRMALEAVQKEGLIENSAKRYLFD
jgi:polar amino acid transport system substrate-binding protein